MLVKRIREGEMIPSWYGVAWDDWMRREAVCLPFGVNIVAQFARAVYFEVKHGNRAMRNNVRAAYDQGYADGKRSK